MFHRFASPYHFEPAYPGYGGYARPRWHNPSSFHDDEELRYAQALENRRREAQYAHALNHRRRQAKLAAIQQEEEYEEEMARREQNQQTLLAQRQAALVAQAERVQQAKLKKLNFAATTVTHFLKRALAKQAATRILNGLKQVRSLRTAFRADVAAYTTALTADPPRTEKQAHMQLLQQQDRLERSLLKTDSITTHGDPFLRAQRKAIVAEIQHALTRLDADVDASSSSASSPGSRASSVSPARTQEGTAEQHQEEEEGEEEEEATALATFFAELSPSPQLSVVVDFRDTAGSDDEAEAAEALQLFFETALTHTVVLEDSIPAATAAASTPPGTSAARPDSNIADTMNNCESTTARAFFLTSTTTFDDIQAQFEALTRAYRNAIATLDTSIATLPAAQTPDHQAERDALKARLQRINTALVPTTTALTTTIAPPAPQQQQEQ